MENRITHIENYLKSIDNVEVVSPFNLMNEFIYGGICINLENDKLTFKVVINPLYPFKTHEVDTISFINPDLLKFNHVNADGSICIHTSHSPELIEKLQLDIDALKKWIDKYYTNNDKDSNYEHIIVPSTLGNGINTIFLFTDINYSFKRGQFGFCHYSSIAQGTMYNNKAKTYIIQDFRINNEIFTCKWSGFYKILPKERGIYIFIENPPVENNRFAVDNWLKMGQFADQNFLEFLNKIRINLPTGNKKPDEIILLIGYKINLTEIHWQAIRIKTNDFPCYGVKNQISKKFESELDDKKINWATTKNCSYKYFFGRGTLTEKLVDSNILLIGIGAIGSIVATTLVRGGCKKLTLIDYDIKEPENVCRAEYSFITGVNNKVNDLGLTLCSISPFVEIVHDKYFFDYVKFAFNSHKNHELAKFISQYDIVFDCSTDNDVAYILSQLDIKSELFNLSTTNHAKELVCVVKPNSYEWLMKIFKELENDVADMYNPTGCWSPTYKASYNDICTLVQYAIKHINLLFEKQLPLRNFYLGTSFDNGFTIKLNQF